MLLFEGKYGKKHQSVWQQFANDINGTLIPGHYGNADSVEVYFENYKINFDVYTHYATAGSATYEMDYIRINAFFVSRDQLHFAIYRQKPLLAIGKLFGAQDIVVGDDIFDKAFIIKGNDAFKIQSLFANKKIKKILLAEKDFRLEIVEREGLLSEELPKEVSVLYYFTEYTSIDLNQLKSLFVLYQELLTELTRLGVALPVKE